jgi:subtilisin family serine protease
MRRKPITTLLATAVITAAAALSVPVTAVVAAPKVAVPKAESNAQAKKYSNSLYIVRLAEMPVVAYDGSIKGYAATKPRKGQKIDPQSPRVVNYKSYLDSRHDAVLASVGGRKVYDYGYVFNGFAAELTEAQAQKLALSAGVLSVTKDEARAPDTNTTPTFLGLNAPGGFWSQMSGNSDGNPIISNGPNSGGAGEGVIVGMVDSGIWPENPSFSDRDSAGKLVYQQIPGWHGKCVPGEYFTASDCNQKLISARWYADGFGGKAGVKAELPYEIWSARDVDGHGTHTASTAAGNYNVTAIANGNNLGQVSGMAPRARIAVYKVCWGIPPEGGCFNSDSVAAIDQAVADGVDVINFSISGSTTSFLDPVEVAFLFAADAGVFVAASAGNSGPNASTVAHNSPWLTTVAAGTKDRIYQATATLGNGSSYTGVGLGAAVPSSPLVLSTNAGLDGADPTAARLCFSSDWAGTQILDPAKVTGKIVVCDRGTSDRVDKSKAVLEAGGVGMILVNTSPNSLNADLHSVPTVHLADTYRAAIVAYGSTTNPTASLGAGTLVPTVAPTVASFSSRGPALAGGGDILKPDIMAPGVDVLAAFSPYAGGLNFNFLSGTSMSSPHIAGIGALMKQAHPTWTPAMIKSALMTSASQTMNDGNPIPGNPFGFGAGQVTPNSGIDPGLVYNAGFNDWLAFLCGTGQLAASYCPSIAIDPSDLNYPSIAIGSLAGVQTVTRKVTNVGSQTETFTASASVAGISTAVSPNSLTVAPGQTKSFTVTFTQNSAALNAYTFGSLTWNGDKGHVVRSPIAIRPVALAVPSSVSGSGGPINYDVAFGYTGAFSATARGMVAGTATAGTVADDPTNGSCSLTAPNAQLIPVTIPAGTTYARYSLFDADVNPGSDLDMCVFLGTSLVGSSGTGTSNEEVSFAFSAPIANPIALTVVVQGWGVVGSTPFKLYNWYLGASASGNMIVSAPASATLGSTGSIGLTFNGLAPATKYLGSVAYAGAAGLPSPTIVRVDTP